MRAIDQNHSFSNFYSFCKISLQPFEKWGLIKGDYDERFWHYFIRNYNEGIHKDCTILSCKLDEKLSLLILMAWQPI